MDSAGPSQGIHSEILSKAHSVASKSYSGLLTIPILSFIIIVNTFNATSMFNNVDSIIGVNNKTCS